jgi:hypothetical protein
MNQAPQDKKVTLVFRRKWENEDDEGGQSDEGGEKGKATQTSDCEVPSATDEVKTCSKVKSMMRSDEQENSDDGLSGILLPTRVSDYVNHHLPLGFLFALLLSGFHPQRLFALVPVKQCYVREY